MDGKCVAIDFGACNIKSTYLMGKKIRSIRLNSSQQGGSEAPDSLFYDRLKDGSISPKLKRDLEPEDYSNTVLNVKQKLTFKEWNKFINNIGRTVNAEECTTEVFKLLKARIQAKSGAESDTLDVAITYPVCFSEIQKTRLRNAIELAGFNVTIMLTEPFAALFSVKNDLDLEEPQLVLVFDSGGSTLDISLMEILQEDDGLKVIELACKGMAFGGINIDQAIYEYFANTKYPDEFAKINAVDDKGSAQDEIINEIIKVKESLYDEDEEMDEFSYTDRAGNFYEFELSKSEIDKLLDSMDIKRKINELLDELFEDAEESADQFFNDLHFDNVDEEAFTYVQPIGGTAHIGYLLDLLEERFDCFSKDDVEWPDEDDYVARGASEYSKIMGDDEGMNVHSVIPFNVGIGSANGSFVRLLPKTVRKGSYSKSEAITMEQLNADDFVIHLYQSFSNKYRQCITDEQVIYMGFVKLDKDKYTNSDAITVKLYKANDNDIFVVTSEVVGGEIMVRERLPLQIGV